MVEIAKCRLCGSDPVPYEDWWECPEPSCCVCGPNDDYDGTKWTALMAPISAPEPAAGAVRVRIGYWRHHYRGHHLWDMELVPSDERAPDVIITADIPLPQPVEIPGAVESGS